MAVIAPKEEFRSLTRAQVVAALEDDPANPIAVEVERLIEAYTTAPEECIRPRSGLSPIEEIAWDVTIARMQQAIHRVELEVASIRKALDDQQGS